MTTLTRTTSRSGPSYKDYVNFVGSYRNGRKDDNPDSGVPSPLSRSSSGSSDATDFAKSSCVSFNTYLENSKNKKFNPVKPTVVEDKTEKKTERSEIFIEIQPVKSVSEVSKIFENKDKSPPPPKNKVNAKIDVFERQSSAENKPKPATKPFLGGRSPPPMIEIQIKVPSPPPPSVEQVLDKDSTKHNNETTSPPPPPPPMMVNLSTKKVAQNAASAPPLPPPVVNLPAQNGASVPPPPPLPPVNLPTKKTAQNATSTPPPPPPMVNLSPKKDLPSTKHAAPKMQATLTRGPQIKHAVSNPNGVVPGEIDRNDPMVRKLVYGTLRGLYGAYHDKANDIMATLPKDRVKKSNGVQDIIDKIASSGDLDKLNGRVNPKLEQD